MTGKKDPFVGTGMVLVTDKQGSISDPCRPAAQLLRRNTMGLLSKEEVVGILAEISTSESDADRIYRELLKEKYLKVM